jgi:hypothetical protein
MQLGSVFEFSTPFHWAVSSYADVTLFIEILLCVLTRAFILFFLVVLGFHFRTLSCYTGALPLEPALFALVLFQVGFHALCPGMSHHSWLVLWDRVFTSFIAQSGLKPQSFSFYLPSSWNYKHELLWPANSYLVALIWFALLN